MLLRIKNKIEILQSITQTFSHIYILLTFPVTGRWFSSGTLVSSTYKTDCHDVAEILLKVALNTIILTLLAFPVLSLSNLNI